MGAAYWGSSLGPLRSDYGLQASATAGFVLPPTGVFKLARGVNPPNLDALLGATWEDMLTGPAACLAGPAQSYCRPRPVAGP